MKYKDKTLKLSFLSQFLIIKEEATTFERCHKPSQKNKNTAKSHYKLSFFQYC